MHILIIEASLSGHHSIYLERIALAFTSGGNLVTIALPVGVNNLDKIFENLKFNQRVKWFYFKQKFDLNAQGVWGLVSRELCIHKIFGQIYSDINICSKIDYVFLPYLDYCLHAVSLMGSPFGRTKWGGICMRPSFHYKSVGIVAPYKRIDTIKRLLFFRLFNNKTLEKIFSIDITLINYVRESNLSVLSKLHYLADPVDLPVAVDINKFRQSFRTPFKAKVILVYGALDERKGVMLLLTALEEENVLDEWHIWLVGLQSEELRTSLRAKKWSKLTQENRLHIHDNFVSTDIQSQVFAACDVVWVGYVHHYGMSGVLVHAGMHAKPVISAPYGILFWYVTTLNMGNVITTYAAGSVAAALIDLSKLGRRITLGKNGHATFKENTWNNFSKSLAKNED